MDMTSFIMGLVKGVEEGKGVVVLEGTEYTFTDANNDGNVVVEEADDE